MQQSVKWGRWTWLAGLAFGVPMGVLFGAMSQSLPAGALSGAVCGLLFGVAMRAFARSASETTAFEPDGQDPVFGERETVFFSGPANHFKGAEGVGGKLHLTSERLRFRSHVVNVQTHDESYPLGSIIRVEPSRTLGLIPNGLLVHLQDGRRERFVVHDRNEWVSRIRAAVSSVGGPFRAPRR